ncbi:MAG: YIP1 family protein [Yoonia sp.]|uniref:YIP1 family protein n=1 Tax=Yoonia sp. TaxID=2212373 RepID=UPI003EF28BB6
MTFDFQTWMRAVWTSIMEPSAAAEKAIGMKLSLEALWTGLALVAVLNVIMLAVLQMVAPAPVALQGQTLSLSPFAYAAIIGIFLALFVMGTLYTGNLLGGTGTLAGTLTIIVWFQAISLTLEAIQLVLVLISPAISSLFGLLSMGVLVWCFVNFTNVLHGFNNLGKAILTMVLALLGTAMCAGIVLAIFGFNPTGGTL